MKNFLLSKVQSKIKILVLEKKKNNLEFGLDLDTDVSEEELLNIIKEVSEENKELIISERKAFEENIKKFYEKQNTRINNQVKKMLIEAEMSVKRVLNSFKKREDE